MSDKYNIEDHVFLIGKLTSFSHCLDDDTKLFIKRYEDSIKKVFCSALKTRIAFKQDYYQKKYYPIQKEIDKINIYIICEPVFNAWYDLEKNSINLSLYLLNIFIRLYNFQNLARGLRTIDTMNLDKFKDHIFNVHSRKRRLSEFKILLAETPKYEIKEIKGELHLLWFDQNNYEFEYNGQCVEHGISLVYCHEMMHWHINRFKKEIRDQFIEEAKKMLFFCISEYSFFDIQKFLSIKPDAVEAWAEEICADFIAFDMAFASDNNIKKQKDTYLAIAYYYVALRVNELVENDVLNRNEGLKLNESHPPAAVRELTVMHWRAKVAEMSYIEYMLKMAGPWLYIYSIFDATITDLLEEIN